jgi:hypothetical protein
MAYAAYCDSFNSLGSIALPVQSKQVNKLMVLHVTVPSCEAFEVRRLVHYCPQAGVLRCTPKLRDHTVVLEIQVPANRVDDIMHVLMTSVPAGEVGNLTSWRHHLNAQGMTHGF